MKYIFLSPNLSQCMAGMRLKYWSNRANTAIVEVKTTIDPLKRRLSCEATIRSLPETVCVFSKMKLTRTRLATVHQLPWWLYRLWKGSNPLRWTKAVLRDETCGISLKETNELLSYSYTERCKELTSMWVTREFPVSRKLNRVFLALVSRKLQMMIYPNVSIW